MIFILKDTRTTIHNNEYIIICETETKLVDIFLYAKLAGEKLERILYNL